jgi:hypothetical protein
MNFFYFTTFLILILVAYAGVEETLRLFAYIDLQIKYAIVILKMKWIGWNLKRQLIKDTSNFEKFLKEYKNDR